jgi:hypothetical protein
METINAAKGDGKEAALAPSGNLLIDTRNRASTTGAKI